MPHLHWLIILLLFPLAALAGAVDLPVTDGLVLWLNDSGIENHNGRVALWKDSSGGNHHAAQETTASQPIYMTGLAALNNKTAARFEYQSNAFMIVSHNLVHDASAATVFMALNLRGIPLDSASRPFGNTGTPKDIFGFMFGDEGEKSGYPHFVVGLSAGKAKAARGPVNRRNTAAPIVLSARARSGSIQVWDNGVAGSENTEDWEGQRISADSPKYVGGMEDNNQAANYFNAGDIPEIIVYTNALSTAQRGEVENYLMKKHNIPVATKP